MNQISSSVRGFHRWLAPTLKVLKRKRESLPQRPQDPRKSYLEWNYDAELYAFGKRLGEDFNKETLKRALTENSYLLKEESKQRDVGMEPEIKLKNNDELVGAGHEFMEEYISRYLKTNLPKLPSVYRTKLKDYLMSEERLAHVSKHIGINDVILSSRDWPDEESLGRGLKAVVQAVGDRARAGRLVRDLVISQLCGYDLTLITTPDKPLPELESNLDLMKLHPPEYRLITECGINTLLPVYQVGVYSDRVYLGRGSGESITVAKEMAACDALWRIWGIHRRKPFTLDLEPPKMAPYPYSPHEQPSSTCAPRQLN